MGKMFPKQSQTQVRFELGDGQSFNCPMLGIGQLDQLTAIRDDLGVAEAEEQYRAVKARMIALAATVLPEEYAKNLPRFQLDKLSELLAYLAYGDDNDLPAETSVDSPSKKK